MIRLRIQCPDIVEAAYAVETQHSTVKFVDYIDAWNVLHTPSTIGEIEYGDGDFGMGKGFERIN